MSEDKITKLNQLLLGKYKTQVMFTEQGFLKALDVVNKATQAAGRVQYANRVRERELEEDREHGKRKHCGNRGYEYER